jgi:hypothetical protein
MSTTIQVGEDTLEFLKQLRERLNFSSYDALLRELILQKNKPNSSFWGKSGRMTMKQILHNLRDKSDRY